METTLEKVAKYIAETQPQIDQYNENRNLFIKRAYQAAGVLANRGLIQRDKVNAFVDKIAEDASGTEVWDLVEKLAEHFPVEELGEAAEKAASAGANLDAFEKWALFGDPRAEAQTPGLVD